MEIKIIFKKCIRDFLMVQAGITLAMGVICCINPPSAELALICYLCLLYMPFSVYFHLSLSIQKGMKYKINGCKKSYPVFTD